MSGAETDVRDTLEQAARDLGDDLAAHQALHFFDVPKEFLDLEGRGDKPGAAELASDILRSVLINDERIYVLDWAAGGEDVVDAFDDMLETLGAPAIEPQRREELIAKVERAKRGRAVPELKDSMRDEVEARGLRLHWWRSDEDAYFPLVLTPAAHDRWRAAKFGKKVPVLR